MVVIWWSTIPHIGKCARTSGQTDASIAEDYDIHVPLSAIPLGVNVGPSLEILSFRSDENTGELPWIARRGWLAVGDVLVSLEGEDLSEVKFRAVRYSFLAPLPVIGFGSFALITDGDTCLELENNRDVQK